MCQMGNAFCSNFVQTHCEWKKENGIVALAYPVLGKLSGVASLVGGRLGG